jgi:hypothetical protein
MVPGRNLIGESDCLFSYITGRQKERARRITKTLMGRAFEPARKYWVVNLTDARSGIFLTRKARRAIRIPGFVQRDAPGGAKQISFFSVIFSALFSPS